SNGPVEGHINRLKMLKRQMYGRAKIDLLERRLEKWFINACVIVMPLLVAFGTPSPVTTEQASFRNDLRPR
ncbi:MAG: hypothetical protein V7L23_19775, partial [Nostoc sp.]|uniref:hypothetical protein n=1 Tax=Nostoc sp. TaxID=1180 RepID=UPI002FEFA226